VDARIHSLPGSLLAMDDDPGNHHGDQDPPEVPDDLEEDLGDEVELLSERHVEVFLNHGTIMIRDVGNGTLFIPDGRQILKPGTSVPGTATRREGQTYYSRDR